ncbi:MAG: polyphosphate kinase 1, partial [Clostridiales bacterium]|nr:polyphosphate kinase 1 [Clostridiales bacterium]
EHSRIYLFGEEDPEVYIASADFMTRNTTRRVEVATPVFDEEIKGRVIRIFRVLMADNVKARMQLADGTYTHVKSGEEPLNAQEYFMEAGNR